MRKSGTRRPIWIQVVFTNPATLDTLVTIGRERSYNYMEEQERLVLMKSILLQLIYPLSFHENVVCQMSRLPNILRCFKIAKKMLKRCPSVKQLWSGWDAELVGVLSGPKLFAYRTMIANDRIRVNISEFLLLYWINKTEISLLISEEPVPGASKVYENIRLCWAGFWNEYVPCTCTWVLIQELGCSDASKVDKIWQRIGVTYNTLIHVKGIWEGSVTYTYKHASELCAK